MRTSPRGPSATRAPAQLAAAAHDETFGAEVTAATAWALPRASANTAMSDAVNETAAATRAQGFRQSLFSLAGSCNDRLSPAVMLGRDRV